MHDAEALNTKIGRLPVHTYAPSSFSGSQSGMGAMLLWTQTATQGFPGVNIPSFKQGWQNGLAFAALCANWRPDLMDYFSLDPDDPHETLSKAFKTLEQMQVPVLLDVEDVMNVADEKIIMTQMTMIHRLFRNVPPAPRPWERARLLDLPGKVPVTRFTSEPIPSTRVQPSSVPARAQSADRALHLWAPSASSPLSSSPSPSHAKPIVQASTQRESAPPPRVVGFNPWQMLPFKLRQPEVPTSDEAPEPEGATEEQERPSLTTITKPKRAGKRRPPSQRSFSLGAAMFKRPALQDAASEDVLPTDHVPAPGETIPVFPDEAQKIAPDPSPSIKLARLIMSSRGLVPPKRPPPRVASSADLHPPTDPDSSPQSSSSDKISPNSSLGSSLTSVLSLPCPSPFPKSLPTTAIDAQPITAETISIPPEATHTEAIPPTLRRLADAPRMPRVPTEIAASSSATPGTRPEQRSFTSGPIDAPRTARTELAPSSFAIAPSTPSLSSDTIQRTSLPTSGRTPVDVPRVARTPTEIAPYSLATASPAMASDQQLPTLSRLSMDAPRVPRVLTEIAPSSFATTSPSTPAITSERALLTPPGRLPVDAPSSSTPAITSERTSLTPQGRVPVDAPRMPRILTEIAPASFAISAPAPSITPPSFPVPSKPTTSSLSPVVPAASKQSPTLKRNVRASPPPPSSTIPPASPARPVFHQTSLIAGKVEMAPGPDLSAFSPRQEAVSTDSAKILSPPEKKRAGITTISFPTLHTTPTSSSVPLSVETTLPNTPNAPATVLALPPYADGNFVSLRTLSARGEPTFLPDVSTPSPKLATIEESGSVSPVSSPRLRIHSTPPKSSYHGTISEVQVHSTTLLTSPSSSASSSPFSSSYVSSCCSDASSSVASSSASSTSFSGSCPCSFSFSSSSPSCSSSSSTDALSLRTLSPAIVSRLLSATAHLPQTSPSNLVGLSQIIEEPVLSDSAVFIEPASSLPPLICSESVQSASSSSPPSNEEYIELSSSEHSKPVVSDIILPSPHAPMPPSTTSPLIIISGPQARPLAVAPSSPPPPTPDFTTSSDPVVPGESESPLSSPASSSSFPVITISSPGPVHSFAQAAPSPEPVMAAATPIEIRGPIAFITSAITPNSSTSTSSLLTPPSMTTPAIASKILSLESVGDPQKLVRALTPLAPSSVLQTPSFPSIISSAPSLLTPVRRSRPAPPPFTPRTMEARGSSNPPVTIIRPASAPIVANPFPAMPSSFRSRSGDCSSVGSNPGSRNTRAIGGSSSRSYGGNGTDGSTLGEVVFDEDDVILKARQKIQELEKTIAELQGRSPGSSASSSSSSSTPSTPPFPSSSSSFSSTNNTPARFPPPHACSQPISEFLRFNALPPQPSAPTSTVPVEPIVIITPTQFEQSFQRMPLISSSQPISESAQVSSQMSLGQLSFYQHDPSSTTDDSSSQTEAPSGAEMPAFHTAKSFDPAITHPCLLQSTHSATPEMFDRPTLIVRPSLNETTAHPPFPLVKMKSLPLLSVDIPGVSSPSSSEASLHCVSLSPLPPKVPFQPPAVVVEESTLGSSSTTSSDNDEEASTGYRVHTAPRRNSGLKVKIKPEDDISSVSSDVNDSPDEETHPSRFGPSSTADLVDPSSAHSGTSSEETEPDGGEHIVPPPITKSSSWSPQADPTPPAVKKSNTWSPSGSASSEQQYFTPSAASASAAVATTCTNFTFPSTSALAEPSLAASPSSNASNAETTTAITATTTDLQSRSTFPRSSAALAKLRQARRLFRRGSSTGEEGSADESSTTEKIRGPRVLRATSKSKQTPDHDPTVSRSNACSPNSSADEDLPSRNGSRRRAPSGDESDSPRHESPSHSARPRVTSRPSISKARSWSIDLASHAVPAIAKLASWSFSSSPPPPSSTTTTTTTATAPVATPNTATHSTPSSTHSNKSFALFKRGGSGDGNESSDSQKARRRSVSRFFRKKKLPIPTEDHRPESPTTDTVTSPLSRMTTPDIQNSTPHPINHNNDDKNNSSDNNSSTINNSSSNRDGDNKDITENKKSPEPPTPSGEDLIAAFINGDDSLSEYEDAVSGSAKRSQVDVESDSCTRSRAETAVQSPISARPITPTSEDPQVDLMRRVSFLFPDEKEEDISPSNDPEEAFLEEEPPVPPSQPPVPVPPEALSGYLRKKSPKSVMSKRAWQKRFFVLGPEQIDYYTAINGSALGFIPLESVISVIPTPPLRFTISIAENRQYELMAETPVSAKQWIDRISTNIELLVKQEEEGKVGIEFEGYLSKKSPKKVFGKSVWQKRFFKLHGPALTYYKKKGATCKGFILFNSIESVNILPSKPTRMVLEFRSVPPRHFHLVAPDAKIATQWLAAMTEALADGALLAKNSPAARSKKEWKLRPSMDGGPRRSSSSRYAYAQFRVPPETLEGIKLGYPHPVPKILVNLRKYFLEHQGLDVVGVFRLNADAHALMLAKDQLNCGRFEKCSDVNVIANLIKIWFRELPIKLLNPIDPMVIPVHLTADQAGSFICELREPFHSLALWLLDLCVLVSLNERVNNMTPGNLATVLGPNLSCRSDNPHVLADHCERMVVLWKHAIVWRAIDYNPDAALEPRATPNRTRGKDQTLDLILST